jgi:DNA-nicking Smr family endonuclease
VTKRAGDDDAQAFAEAMRGAKPIAPDGRARLPKLQTQTRGAPPRQTPAARARAAAASGLGKASPDAFDGGATFEVETFGDSIEGRAVGLDVKLLRRLKSGERRALARLDLHGHQRDEALRALERFVEGARGQGKRCVLVIHGRGAHSPDDAPVLKPLVWRWLVASTLSRSAVLAFTSAPPAQGGDGATLLLLRKAA